MTRVPRIRRGSRPITTGNPAFDLAFADARTKARALGQQMGGDYARMMLATMPDPALAADTLEASLDSINIAHLSPGVPTPFLDMLKAEIKQACVGEVNRLLQPNGKPENEQ